MVHRERLQFGWLFLRFSTFILCLFSTCAFGNDKVCREVTFENARFVVCEFDLAEYHIRLVRNTIRGPASVVYAGLATQQDTTGKPSVSVVMNAGMYDAELAPIGFYVEDGVTYKKANTARGAGNFHLLPNGVFYIQKEKAGVLETKAFIQSGITPDYATQSGPMLVINEW